MILVRAGVSNCLRSNGRTGIIASEEEDVPVAVEESYSGNYSTHSTAQPTSMPPCRRGLYLASTPATRSA